MYEAKRFSQFALGDKSSFEKTVTEADVVLFAGISGDYNPLHMNAEFAKTTLFKERIAHGALVNSFISAAAAQFVGVGAIYLSQLSKFMRPVKIGDTIKATVEVVQLMPEKERLQLRTYCVNQQGQVVIDGEAVIMLPTPK